VVNRKARENFEVRNIWLRKRDSSLGPLGLQRLPIGGEFRVSSFRLPLHSRLIDGRSAGLVSALGRRARADIAMCRWRLQSNGEPESRGIMLRNRASPILNSP
jgi:hypothetical protein